MAGMNKGDGATGRAGTLFFSAEVAAKLVDVAIPILIAILLVYTVKMQTDLVQTMDEDLKTAFGLTDILIVCMFMLCRRRK